MRQVIRVKDGEVTCLYSDTLNLRRMIGPSMQVSRASDVEWDSESKGWVATMRGDYSQSCSCVSHPPCPRSLVKLGPYPTRAEALAAEVEFLQIRLRG